MLMRIVESLITFIVNLYYINLESINMFKNKTLLITGGTGSFGNAVLNRFLNSDLST